MADVGEIVYQVQMDVGQLLTSQRQLEQRLNRIDDSFNRTSRAANNTEQSMLSLSKVAGVVASALSAGAIINAVDEWGQMAARIKMALNSVEGDVERYAEIQQRFLEVSNRNGKAIETTQELYAGSATSMKELGYNTTQTVDYIESLSSAFTANATGAQQTESAMNALNRAMVIGTLKGNDWHSVLNATPSVVADIAKELSRLRGGVKVTENDVKKMAMQGGISMKLFADAMIKAREENNALADSMDNTIADGFTKLTNSAKAYYGEMNQTLGITRSVSAGFAVLTDNFEKVSMVANVALAILGARMAGALYSTIKAKISDVSASINQTTATLNAAKASEYAATTAVRKAQADLSSARSAVALAQAEYDVAKGTLAEATALDNLILKKSLASKAALTLTQATQAQTAAMANSATAARAASVSMNLFKGALGLVGGPAGAAMLAGAAVLYFYQQANEARESAIKLAEGVDELTAKMKEMSRVQKEAEMAELRKALPELNNELLNAVIAHSKAIGAVKDLESQVAKATPGTSKYTSLTNQLTSAQDDLAIATNNAQKATNDYSRAKSTISLIQADLNGTLKQGAELLQREASMLPNAAAGWNSYGFSIERATKAKAAFSLLKPELDYGGEDGNKLLKQMERRLELSKLEGAEKAKLNALYAAEDAGVFDKEAIKNLQDLAAKEYENTEAKKQGVKTAKEAASAALKEATEAEKLKQKITDVANATKVAELETKGLAREAAILEAVQKLGSKATKAQIAEITELAGKEFDLKQKIQDRKDAFSQNPEAKANQEYKLSLEQLERQLQGNLVTEEDYHRRRVELAGEYSKKIAEANADKTVSPQDNLKAQVDPVQQLKNEHERKLALIKEYENQKVLTEQQSLELMNAANTQYEQDRMNAQWEIWRNQSQANQFLADGLDALGQRSANVITGLLTGTQSLNDAFRNVALTIVDQAVGALVQMGMQQVKNMITENAMRKASNAQAVAEATATGGAITAAMAPAAATTSIATMGSAATWGMAAMAAAIPAMIALAGARKNGGQVGAGKMYQVGEGGKPEIFKASNGSQYMIPGDNGRVISNRQMGKGGNGVSMGDMHFTFQVQAPNGITQKEAQQIQQMVRGTVYDVLGTEMRSGGALEKSRSW